MTEGPKLHHIAIATNDVEKLSEFYERVIGLKRQKVWMEPDSRSLIRSIWLTSGDIVIMIEKSILKPSADDFFAKNVGYHLIAFAIQEGDKEKYLDVLKNNSVEIKHRSNHSIYFQDPDGNRIAFSWYPMG